MFEDLVTKKEMNEEAPTTISIDPVPESELKCPYCSSKYLNKGVLFKYNPYWRQFVVCGKCSKTFTLLWLDDMSKAYIETQGKPTKS